MVTILSYGGKTAPTGLAERHCTLTYTMLQLRIRTFTTITFVATLSFASASLYAAPLTLKGAKFDAPETCQIAGGALVCKIDAQQFELWIERTPLANTGMPVETFSQRMNAFGSSHETAVASVMRTTSNDTATTFSNYGSYSAIGAAMPGKGSPTSPAVRFASLLHEDEVWEIMEVVATRTPGIDTLSKALQASLVLPPPTSDSAAKSGAKPATKAELKSTSETPAIANSESTVATSPPAQENDNSPIATLTSALLTLEYPRSLEAIIVANTSEALVVNFKHRTRAAGPHLSITLRTAADKKSAATVANEKKSAIVAALIPGSASVEINALGSISGSGHAIIGTPDKKKSGSGIETLETVFVADLNERRLEVRLNAEEKYAEDSRYVWSTLAKSIALKK